MVTNKHIEKIVAVIMAVALVMCFAMMLFSENLSSGIEAKGLSLEYETKLFNTDKVMEINFLINDDEWQNMLDNAMAEEYIKCDIEVNGTTFKNVAMRPKGNTSLSNIAMDSETDRYSFKIEFDRYNSGQTCWGLDKLILNNNFADATNIKEALIYDMYQYIGADASLTNFAKISVNGKYWGVYLALEAVEDSFMLRNYGAENGKLYKPENVNMGGGDKDGMKMPDIKNAEMTNLGDMQIPDMNDGERPDFDDKGGFGGMGGGGSDLNYSDDNLNSYSTIWDSAINSSTTADHKRVVTALKNISEGNDLEKYMDIDNLLKYMAVHVFSVNEDSLSGSMAHNYYLYEHNGKLNILPWDYNLIFGGMGMKGNSSDTINDPIDTPFSATKFFDKLLENEVYLAKYHEYLQMLTEKYIDGGEFESFYNRTLQKIDELVTTDPTAFYSVEEYQTAAELFKTVVNLRSQSIQGQLDGSIPSTSDGQKENATSLVNTDGIDLSVMGSMNMGGMQPPGNNGDMPNVDKITDFEGGEMPDFPNGEMPEGFDPSNMPQGANPPDFSNNTEDTTDSESNNGRPSFGGDTGQGGQNGFSPFGNQNSANNSSSSIKTNLILIGSSFAILLTAILIAKFYRRKNFRK